MNTIKRNPIGLPRDLINGRRAPITETERLDVLEFHVLDVMARANVDRETAELRVRSARPTLFTPIQ